MSKNNNKEIYWVNAETADELAQFILEKFENTQRFFYSTGYNERNDWLSRSYYGLNKQGSLRLDKNADGDLTHINLNHLHALVDNIVHLVTQNDVAGKGAALNSDYKSKSQVKIVNGWLEYLTKTKKLQEKIFTPAALKCMLFNECYAETCWDKYQGRDIRPDNDGNMIKAGDINFNLYTPYDIGRDTKKVDSNWYIIRKRVNKYDLATVYPEYREDILNTTDEIPSWQNSSYIYNYLYLNNKNEDYTWIYVLYHKVTPSVPRGKYAVVCGTKLLEASGLKYKSLPVQRLVAGEMQETVFGYSPTNLIAPIQEAIGAISTALISNSLNYSLTNVWSQTPDVDIQQITEGMNLIVSQTKPEGLIIQNNSAENAKLIDILVNQAQLLTNMNSVVRGNPEANLRAGNALALVLAQAINAVSSFQNNYYAFCENILTDALNNLKSFAKDEQIALIAGVAQRSYVKNFKSSDIGLVDRVMIETVNPIDQTAAGRRNKADQWLQYGIIKTPEEYLMVDETGHMDTGDDLLPEDLQIKMENEMLREAIIKQEQIIENGMLVGEAESVVDKDGVPIMAVLLDAHPKHILKHKQLVNDPEVRKNPMLLKAILIHIQEHVNLMRKVPPDLAAIMSGQPLPPPMAGQNPGNMQQTKGQVEGVNLPLPPEEAGQDAQMNMSAFSDKFRK